MKTDLCIIGAGSGGLSLAAGAVQMGARVVLIEADKMGGDCLNYGCVPSKAFLHGAASKGVGYQKAMEHVQEAIETIAPHDSQERFEDLGCTVIRARAKFVSPKEVDAGGTRIRARRFVVATGSRPFVPEIVGLKSIPYLTNETLWTLKEAPKHLLILGGGPIGVEMAQAHRNFGCKVTLIEGATLLGHEDPEAVDVIRGTFKAQKIALHEGQIATRLKKTADGIEMVLSNGETLTGSHLLIAAGRHANVDGLGLEAAGVAHTPAGIEVNSKLRSSNRRIYAVGDVVAGAQRFTHVAGYHAGVLARSLLFGLPAKANLTAIPRATYTSPELAQIGLTEHQAKDTYGPALTVARAEVSGNDRAIATRQNGSGFIKVMVVKNRPVGVTIAAPQAGEHITLWSLVMTNKLKMSQVAAMVAPYPTLSELNKRAVSAYFTPKLFENKRVKMVVKLIQRLIP